MRWMKRLGDTARIILRQDNWNTETLLRNDPVKAGQ